MKTKIFIMLAPFLPLMSNQAAAQGMGTRPEPRHESPEYLSPRYEPSSMQFSVLPPADGI